MPPVEDHKPHESTKRPAGHKAGCYNSEPAADEFLAQDGWTQDGRRRLVWVTHTMSKTCRQITDLPECEGCTTERDWDYINRMRGVK